MNIIGTLPVTLQNGTTADASQVMSDFNFIVNQVNANGLSTAFIAPGTLLAIQVFNISGTYMPTTNATKALVKAIGGGGAGGGTAVTGAGAAAAGGGGGAGAYGELFQTSGLVTQTVTIGAAGAPGAAGAAGGNGGSTSFGALMVCQGGQGGDAGGAVGSFPNNSGAGRGSAVVTGTGNIIVSAPGATGGIGSCYSTGFVINGLGANTLWGAGGDAFVSSVGRGFGAGGLGNGAGQNSAAGVGFAGSAGRMLIFEFA